MDKSNPKPINEGKHSDLDSNTSQLSQTGSELNRGVKALNATKNLNKRLKNVKLLSQKNLLAPSSSRSIHVKRLGFALNKNSSKSHEVKIWCVLMSLFRKVFIFLMKNVFCNVALLYQRCRKHKNESFTFKGPPFFYGEVVACFTGNNICWWILSTDTFLV